MLYWLAHGHGFLSIVNNICSSCYIKTNKPAVKKVQPISHFFVHFECFCQKILYICHCLSSVFRQYGAIYQRNALTTWSLEK